MIAMRRCTSAIVMEAAPRAAGRCRCAAASPGSAASSSARRYRIAQAFEVGEPKGNAPDRRDLRSGAFPLLCRSRLAPLELGSGRWLLFRGLALRLGPRLTAGWGGLAPRLGRRWRRLGAPPLFRVRSALRLCRRPRALLGPLRSLCPFGPVGPVAPLWTARLVPVLGLVRPVAAVGLVGSVPMIALVGPTAATAVVVVPLVFGAGAPPGRLNVRRRDDARAAQVSTPHADVAPAIVVYGPLAHPRNEGIRRLAVLENEPGLRPVRTREDDPRAAVVLIRVVVRIIEDHDPKAHAGVVVGAPGRVAHVRVAVVAQEPGIVVVLFDVVRRDVVIPLTVAVGHDALCQVGKGDVRIAADPPVGDLSIIPVVLALDAVVHERIRRGDGEQVADTGIVIDVEGVAVVSALHFVVAPTEIGRAHV